MLFRNLTTSLGETGCQGDQGSPRALAPNEEEEGDKRIFSSTQRLVHLWDQPNFTYSGYRRFFPWEVRQPGRESKHFLSARTYTNNDEAISAPCRHGVVPNQLSTGNYITIKSKAISVTGRGCPYVFPVRYEHHLHIKKVKLSS
jgi:hypothetical protein